MERVGVEGRLQRLAGLGFTAQPHQQQAQPGVRLRLAGKHADRLAEILFRRGVLVADLQHFGKGRIEFAGMGIAFDDLADEIIEAAAGRDRAILASAFGLV